MNHNPSGDNANVSPTDRAVSDREASVLPHRLNLSLQQALGCLDIKLEDELTRFRSKQADRQSMNDSAANWEQESGDEADVEIITGEIIRSALAHPSVDRDDRIDAGADLTAAPQSGGFIIIDGIHTPNANLTAIAPLDYESRAARSNSSNHYERMDLNFSPRGEMTSFDREYSASSQELLRQIQSGYTAPADAFATRARPAATPTKSNLFTPLKIGSLALACAIAGGAAYTYLHPAILAPLTATKSIVPVATASSSLGGAIQSPNLAATEFTDLNLSTIVGVKMPTIATTNASTATTSIANPTAGVPVAIPYNGMNTAPLPSTPIVAQPRLADSLVRSLLPPNFHTFAKQPRYRAAQPGLRR